MREAARKDGDLKFTALLHHADVDALRRSFFRLKKTAAVGSDGVTWQSYEQALEENLIDLHGRIHRGSYRAKPALRRYINKPDGRKRALGIAVLEDKIVQHAVSEILQNVHEPDFLGFSYGFRKGKSQHNALDALYMGIFRKKVNWILDADIPPLPSLQSSPPTYVFPYVSSLFRSRQRLGPGLVEVVTISGAPMRTGTPMRRPKPGANSFSPTPRPARHLSTIYRRVWPSPGSPWKVGVISTTETPSP